ncbi:MAG: BMP family ABC transporter substrate-binding protein [Candidatus Nanopelagicaceae bacterium]|nr:BMP family ABC transporter substrate-binding protein [Candidatus Nanopelagicaceae bacterium]
MRLRIALLAFSLLLPQAVAGAQERTPRIAVAYDIGFKGDGGFNDAVSEALALAKKRFDLVPPFVREVPTSGTPVDRLSKLRFLAKNGYTLIITIGSGYRETVRRVSMEYPETQFAPINDKTLGQLNVSNIFFNEVEAARIAGTIARARSKTKVVAVIAGTEEVNSAFAAAANGAEVLKIPFSGDVSTLNASLGRADVIYSLWDRDAKVYEFVINRTPRTFYIARNPDQYFANLQSHPRVIAVIEKRLTKPISQLVRLALEDRALIDVIDSDRGIYGRSYGVANGGLTYKLKEGQPAVVKALRELKG